ncbi:hypothetical protein [Brevibacillus sp. SAFN-007a]|uniref:hypothetical protein n=1 Tax=Brevibacillus sp. SAFN-007a TaxID=3436862 RepID=UPI003F7DB24A
MKKKLGMIVASLLFVSALSTPVSAEYDEAYRAAHPDITQQQYNYGVNVMNQQYIIRDKHF